MEYKRRSLRGKPLLAASAGILISVAGCNRTPPGNLAPPPPGNLMAPPMVEVCVTAEPKEAQITVQGNPLEADGCNQVYEGNVTIEATAPGYQPYQQQIQAASGPTPNKHTITLTKQTP